MDSRCLNGQPLRVPALPEGQSKLRAPISALAGVGPRREEELKRLDIHTVEDLLLHRPRRYEDRRHFQAIADICEKGAVAARGRIVALGVKYFRRRTRSIFEIVLDDGTGRLHCRWWNQPFLKDHYAAGQEYLVYGKVVELRPRTMDHPETELIDDQPEDQIHINRIVPIYPLTAGLTQRWMRARIWGLVQEFAASVPEPYPGLATAGLPTRAEALRQLHFPEDLAAAEKARCRLAFDEFAALQVDLQKKRAVFRARAKGPACRGDNRLVRPFLARLGFQLTPDQTKVLREIRQDLGGGPPMRRLLQGDVGAGKTVVAAASALMTLESGYQVALMAPTAILAHQHWTVFQNWFSPLGIPVRLQTSARKVMEDPGSEATGADDTARPGITIGTHALLQSAFVPENLGLVIVDEQHKFGVTQRESLVRKGRHPHLLVMTATPIPRTLALTLYGDLDVSVIRSRPVGRATVRTFVRATSSLPKVWDFVRQQLASGRQAYVVLPRVEEDESGEVKAVMKEHARLAERLSPFVVAPMHGRLPAEQRLRVMTDFRGGRIHVLLATIVIEVGVDVPNATVMVIENAEHFGLAQLHQLRGRIGRGQHASYCILVPGDDTPQIRARLDALVSAADGFAVAEADLRLRGPGELLGRAQSGTPSFRFGDLVEDASLVEMARTAVADWLKRGEKPAESGPALSSHLSNLAETGVHGTHSV